jgi:hypothetical protein
VKRAASFILLALLSTNTSRLFAADDSSTQPRVRIERQQDKLLVEARNPDQSDWTRLATYVCPQGLRPYLHPVYDASGRHVLTQDRPDDHPWQHGIFTGFHRINGFNYWKEDEGRQRFVRLLDLKQELNRVQWTALIELVAPGGEVVLEEENTVAFHPPESTNSYTIDFILLLRAKDKDVQFGKFFVGGLSVRMPWDKSNPQSHLNSNGLVGRAAEQQRAAWCTVERPFGNDTFGIAIFDHPQNPNHPPAWRVDEQGLINPNISGLNDWTLPAHQQRQFHYQLLIYRGPANPDHLALQFKEFSSSK